MHPWQVAFGLSLASVVPLAYYVVTDLGYLSGYWSIAWSHYGFHLLAVPSATVLLMSTAYYMVARLLFLGDVGSRIDVLDRRNGNAGRMPSTAPSRRSWKRSTAATPSACGRRRTASRSVSAAPAACGREPPRPRRLPSSTHQPRFRAGTPENREGSRTPKPSGATRHKSSSNRHMQRDSRTPGADPEDRLN